MENLRHVFAPRPFEKGVLQARNGLDLQVAFADEGSEPTPFTAT